MTDQVRKILDCYRSENPGVLTNLARMLNHGRLAGTGRMIILPVDQGFEHGPARSFAPNPPAYDPAYHFQLAIDAGLNAYASLPGELSFSPVDQRKAMKPFWPKRARSEMEADSAQLSGETRSSATKRPLCASSMGWSVSTRSKGRETLEGRIAMLSVPFQKLFQNQCLIVLFISSSID